MASHYGNRRCVTHPSIKSLYTKKLEFEPFIEWRAEGQMVWVMPLKKKHKKKVPVYYTEHWELGRDQGGRIRKKMEARKKSNSTKAARVH